MGSYLRLTEEERNFLSIVANAAFTNPFEERWSRSMRLIAGIKVPVNRDHLRKQVIESVTRRVRDMERQGKVSITQFENKDRELVESFYLFRIYQMYLEKFDTMIQRQVEAGTKPVTVDFAQDLLGAMTKRGYSDTTAMEYFALFYQIRRAYYFIDRSLIGPSPCMQRLRRQLWNDVFTYNILWYEHYLINRMEDFSTMILGETGTGKGSAANAIGRSGYIPFDINRMCFAESFTRAFVSINLSQYPEQLIESELFGHKKGAFTGAIENHEGVFERCSPHGAIFLDEIGDVSIPIQIKLLQILQERYFSPVGGHEKKRFSGRVIAATNKSIEELRKKGDFRDDFFYRLSSDLVIVPTLRQRVQEDPKELDELVQLILARMTGDHHQELFELIRTRILKQVGLNYDWPGNVRELEQCIRRILLTGQYYGDTLLSKGDFRGLFLKQIEEGSLDGKSLMAGYCRLLHQKHGTYEEVARITELDRRTVKKYVLMGDEQDEDGED